MPGPEELRAIRLHLLDRHTEFNKIVNRRGLQSLMGELKGESLSRVPKGFPPDHLAADLVRRKQWLLWTMLDPALATTPKLAGEIVKRFRAMTPFNDFLNARLVRAPRPLPYG